MDHGRAPKGLLLASPSLTPSPAVAAAATSGPQEPRRCAPGAPTPRTSTRPPAKTAAVEAPAVMVVAAPPPRPPEPPTRTSPNRGHGRLCYPGRAGPEAGKSGSLPLSLLPRRTPGPHVPARATAPRSPSRSGSGLGPTSQVPDLSRPHGAAFAPAHTSCAVQDLVAPHIPRPLPEHEGPQPWPRGASVAPHRI